jgi:4'-phosphopantetheinyl transferase
MPMPLARGHVDLWIARDAQLRDPGQLARWTRSLAPEESARVAGMLFPEDGHQQLVTRGMLREVLSFYEPAVDPGDWRFERNEHGKPRIALGSATKSRELHFNLAHTTGLVVLAVARTPRLGVDVELRGQRAPLKVARRYFSPIEVAALDALPPGEQPLRFQRLWTLKEAYLKAIGTGVAGGLGSMTFHVEPGGPRFERAADPDAAQWRFREFEVPGGYLVALAIHDGESPEVPEVSLRDFPPGPAAPSGQEERAQA